MRHNAVQDAHTVQVYLTVSDGENTGDSTGTGTSPAGKNWPRSWFDTDGFGEGLIAGVIGVAVLILPAFVHAFCRRCCCCCQSRATKLQQAGKRKGTPATKFSKITVLDDDDEIDGLELPSTTSSKEDAVVNEFGISFGSESRGGASSRSHKISNQAKGNGTGASSGQSLPVRRYTLHPTQSLMQNSSSPSGNQ